MLNVDDPPDFSVGHEHLSISDVNDQPDALAGQPTLNDPKSEVSSSSDIWEDECLFIADLFERNANELDPVEEVFVSKVSISNNSTGSCSSRVSSSSKFYVPIVVCNVKLRAVVDTAAEVTVVSDKFLPLLDPAPPILKDVILWTAGRGQKMTAVRIGPVPIKLGQTWFDYIVYSAPLVDDMLLGLDFLQKFGIDISIRQPKLIVEGKEIHMYYGASSQTACIQKACVARTAMVPPTSVKGLRCIQEACVAKTAMVPPISIERLTSLVDDHPDQWLLTEGSKDFSSCHSTRDVPIWTPRIVFDRGKSETT